MLRTASDLYVVTKGAEDDLRLDVQHEAVKASLYGKLHAASAQYEEVLARNPRASILDVATGTGIWLAPLAGLQLFVS